jgi:uncharacterized protein (UPF0332 family)
LALDAIDFKRHKDVVSYFNKTYVASDKFDRDVRRSLSRLRQIREKSDYNDYFILLSDEAEEQIESAELIVETVREFIKDIVA